MRTLSRKKSHRNSMLRNLVTSLLLYESIETTLPKAKEVKEFTDKLICRSKQDNLSNRRYLSSVLFDNNAVNKYFKELLPRYHKRNCGFVKIYKTGYRLGDNAPLAKLELTDKKVFIEENKSSKKNSKSDTKPKEDK